MTRPPELDPVLQDPVRRQICSVLVLSSGIGLDRLQRAVLLSETTVREHLQALAEAGYVRLVEQDTTTDVSLTDAGRSALVADEAERDRLARMLRDRR